MNTRNPYEILQVSTKAEPEVIEAAYKRLAQKYHPDKNLSIDAKSRMQDINWAFSILGDTEKRKLFDSTQRNTLEERRKSANYNAPSISRQRPMPSARVPRPKTKTAYTPNSQATVTKDSQVDKSSPFSKFIIGLGILLLFYVYFSNSQQQNTQNNSADSSSNYSNSLPTSNPYTDCIPWTQAELYDGQHKCVYGIVINVSYEYDDLSGADVWTAHFSFDESRTFKLISVDRDISKWQGECVVVYGTLFDRDSIREYVDDPQPSMVDSDPFDDRGFSIMKPVSNICK